MRHLFLIITALFAIGCGTQKKSQSLLIINGSFFYEMPEQPPHDVYIQMGMLKDDAYERISILNYGTPLSPEALALAIPVKKIKNGEEILERSKSAETFLHQLSNGNPDIKLGETFPDFSLLDNKGQKWTLEDFKGKNVVVNFWYTGCKPCVYEMLELGSWVSKYPDVLFVAATFQNSEQIDRTIKEKKFKFHQLVDAQTLIDAVGLGAYPLTLILDKDSRVILVESGTSPVQRQRIENHLKHLD